MARSLKMDHSYLSRIMAGNRQPTIRHARKIADALGMGLEDFLALVEARKERLSKKKLAKHKT
jgi:transcriptional regulator with XRE-family HTH domain